MNTSTLTNMIIPPPLWLGSGSNTYAITSIPQSDSGFHFAIDGVGMLILIVLLAGLTIAVLLAVIDRLHSLCSQALSLLDSHRRERVSPPTTVIVNAPTDTANTLPAATISERRDERSPAVSAAPARPKSPDCGPKPRTFRVQLAAGLLPKIHQYVTEFLGEHGEENEAGGMLVGNFHHDEPTGVVTFKICGFIAAGPNADFSPGSILFDSEFQLQHLAALQLDHAVVNLGCYHRHPGHMDTCSTGDLATDREAVQDADTKALVFVIITLNNPRQLLSSAHYREFKFDFYLMAEETGYQYQAIQPEIVELPIAEVNPELAALVALRGSDVRYDFALLQQLPKLKQLTVQTQKAGVGVILTAKFFDLTETFRLWLKPDGAVRLIVAGAEQQELQGPWTQPEVGPHVWLAHLFLLARKQLTSVSSKGYQRHYALLHDKNRLVAEKRAMDSAYGNRAVLRRDGDVLYWEYTVHQSGRAFPIKVVYPPQYPSQPPEIISVLPLPGSPHQLGSNKACWIDVYSIHSDWNPARDTAVTAIHAAHRWFACLLVYLTTGKWPDGAND